MTAGGPLFSLRLWGLFCPCFESSENKSARYSLTQLNRLGTRVEWHTTPKTSSTVVGAAFLRGLFGKSGSIVSSSSGGGTSTDDKPPTPAQLKLVDATKDSINYGQPYPQLELKPLPQTTDENDATNSAIPTSDGLMKQNAMSYQLDIPLHHILRVESLHNFLVVVAKDVHGPDEQAEKEACRIAFSSQDDLDAALLDLKVLVEWNKHRQPEGIEENLPASGIRQHAQKAAHFARREIEMREKKRDREKRKAGHMKDGVGMKYTALAMVNNS